MWLSTHEKNVLFHDLRVIKEQQRHLTVAFQDTEDFIMQEFDTLKGDVEGLVAGVAAATVALDDLKAKLDQAIASGNGVTVADVLALDELVKTAKQALADAVLRDDPPVVVDPAPGDEPPSIAVPADEPPA